MDTELDRYEREVRIDAKILHSMLEEGTEIRHPSGTCFAGFEKVYSESLTPDVKKANKLRTQNYW